MRLFRREQPSEPEGPVPDEWAVSEGSHNGKRLIASFHEDLIAALPTHTVQVMAKTDPKWSTYRQFVSS
jgi:hypothetical protein